MDNGCNKTDRRKKTDRRPFHFRMRLHQDGRGHRNDDFFGSRHC